MNLFDDTFLRKTILIVGGIAIAYAYLFNILFSPMLTLLILGIVLGFFSTSLKQSFFNIAITYSGIVLGMVLMIFFQYGMLFFDVARDPAMDLSGHNYSTADLMASFFVVSMTYMAWIVCTPLGYGLRHLYQRHKS